MFTKIRDTVAVLAGMSALATVALNATVKEIVLEKWPWLSGWLTVGSLTLLVVFGLAVSIKWIAEGCKAIRSRKTARREEVLNSMTDLQLNLKESPHSMPAWETAKVIADDLISRGLLQADTMEIVDPELRLAYVAHVRKIISRHGRRRAIEQRDRIIEGVVGRHPDRKKYEVLVT